MLVIVWSSNCTVRPGTAATADTLRAIIEPLRQETLDFIKNFSEVSLSLRFVFFSYVAYTDFRNMYVLVSLVPPLGS